MYLNTAPLRCALLNAASNGIQRPAPGRAHRGPTRHHLAGRPCLVEAAAGQPAAATTEQDQQQGRPSPLPCLPLQTHSPLREHACTGEDPRQVCASGCSAPPSLSLFSFALFSKWTAFTVTVALCCRDVDDALVTQLHCA